LGLGRDPSRTPFQWDPTKNAGFTDGQPWLPLSSSYKSNNVATLRNDPTSLLNLYRHLLSIRRRHVALSSGAFRLIGVQGNAIVYERTAEHERIVICLNLRETEQRISAQEFAGATILASTHGDRAVLDSDFTLRPDEGLVALMAEQASE
jgi:alpha-glucosidase